MVVVDVAVLRRVIIFDSDSIVINVGRTKRIVNGSRTRALHARG
ncbi:MAG TPA: hypothetical protein VNG93_03840 [Candidatus Dormibacteraeota bacterium]|nr:hypothetical protein [Candidatus Dormibacteraeota bacterium]